AVDAQIQAPREAAQIEFGPLSIYPSLRIVDAGIDENVFNEPDNLKEDFTFTVASRALAVMRLGLNEVMFSSGSDYVWFKEYESERSTNVTYAARLNLSASRFKPFIGAERTRTRARASSEIDERARRIERTATVGSAFNLTQRTALTFSAQWSASTFDQGEQFRGTPLDTALNDTVRAYSAGAKYEVTPFTTLLVTGNYIEDIFPDARYRNSKSFSVTPVLEFAPEAALRGRLSAGYLMFDPEDPALSDSKGLILEGVLNWSIAGVTTFDLTVGRNVSYSYQDVQPYYLQTGARFAVTQRLIGPVGLQGTIDRQHLAYRWRRGVVPIGSGDRVDVADLLSGGVVVRLGRGFGMILGAEKTRRHSSEDTTHNFKRTRLLVNVTVGQ
ncbi:MAG TPA: outer membrane beta-barrel protein, partial [Vicinamibacterales bacterium]|nr:outer membrane beta-barrel protein [Vicinamibacterales bacterium]